MDPAAYFRRIGYTSEWTPTLGTLQAIHALHPAMPIIAAPVRNHIPKTSSFRLP